MNQIYPHQLSSSIPLSFIGQIGKTIRTIPGLMLLLWACPLWLTTEAIAPQIVQAYTARVDLTIDRLPDETYENVVRRAETAARAAAQRSFDQDILVTQVNVIVSAQNYGAIAPVLTLDVSRLQWKKRPDPQRWSTYFKTARSLLFFEKQPVAPNPIPPTLSNPTSNQKNSPTPKAPESQPQ
ncbi:hypothetical protein B6N60_02649 [Richelia sinica FACHB-800]|uniref:Uncharacterized protein n=1 Tax=Richelia sinica FACHB-800 TaxID=1357546 RepID=A0A975T874_9NOST|nr:hypothetical protein [Richelia sinica]MBD2665943.1 hypothetical protein [Richelia sinica FACHB-800]QXE23947.1 hypothetical protein B6N60_02649 [Richelia sinica FACHB-800]